jgi:hypothetical protein
MRAAIITSKDDSVKSSPLVIVEDDKGILKYYSQNREADKLDNDNFLYAKKNSPKIANLEHMLHGYSYFDAEVFEYEGSGKEKIDNMLLSIGHKKLDNK